MNSKKKLVVLSGAGISAESGIATFRDSGGLWEEHRVEDVATPGGWQRDKELVLRFYNERRRGVKSVQPNDAHRILAALETDYDVRIITQNIDDLHERAGSSQVLHLHGEILKMRSEHQPHDEAHAVHIEDDIALGHTAPDGGQYRPHIVWFEEDVPAIIKAVEITAEADIFLVIGTSLNVYPAAGLVHQVPPGVPVYVVDKHIPHIGLGRKVTAIEAGAGEGMRRFVEALKR